MYKQSKRQKLSELHRAKGEQFHELFPTELDGLLEIYRLLQFDLTACNICSSENVELLENHRLMKCRDCAELRWLTTDTFFERMKHPKLWLMPIWFDDEGVELNSTQLSILSDAVYSSAHNVMTKFSFTKAEVVRKHDGEHVSSTECILVMKKRSRETPARMSPKQEEFAVQEQEELALQEQKVSEEHSLSSNEVDTGEVALSILNEDERDIHNLLSDVPISFDLILARSGKPHCIMAASLTTLESYGLLERCGGLQFRRSKPKKKHRAGCTADVSSETKISIGFFLEYTIKTFEGISRKYLELYIANYWFHTNWCDELKQKYLKALRHRGPIRREEILAFVTPRQLKFCYPMNN